jgi:hypothetical protein
VAARADRHHWAHVRQPQSETDGSDEIGWRRGITRPESNSEDFYRQELPVPILGLRWTYPLSNRWFLRTSLSGGGLPRVDSGRTEGGTVFLQQAHADLGLAVVYRITDLVHVEAGYHLTYFFQKESSHEDKNLFELIDNGLAVRLGVRF